jgi:copper resistance protein B
MSAAADPCIRTHRRWLAAACLSMPVLVAAQDAGMSMPMPTAPSAQAAAQSGLTQVEDPASMPGMEMNDNVSLASLLVDQLEYADGDGGYGFAWDAEGWYGNDSNKWWLRSEGEGSRGSIENADVEVLWNHPVSAFWGTQLGVRHDLGAGAGRNWAAFGVEGLAPYWVKLEATVYAGEDGRFAARMRAQYTLRFTQRWILQPAFEVNLYDEDDPARRIGGDMSHAQLGLRLRYEITREFAPYLGLVWTRRFGTAADFSRADGQPVFDRQFVIGLRLWF